MLISTIRQQGNHPCPRCLVHKSNLDQMGTPKDLADREALARLDDPTRRALVETARAKLLGSGVAVTNPGVDGPLKGQSYQPVWVCHSI
jgi:hypothetical protein